MSDTIRVELTRAEWLEVIDTIGAAWSEGQGKDASEILLAILARAGLEVPNWLGVVTVRRSAAELHAENKP